MIETRKSKFKTRSMDLEFSSFGFSNFEFPMASIGQTASFPRAFRPPSSAGSGAWLTIREAYWIALEALRAHKLRSFLTLLGVVIATTTLIVVMSIINGMNLYIADHIANLGANVFIVHRFQWAQGYEAWLKARRRNKAILIEEFEFLRDNLKDYKNIGAEADMQNHNTYARYQNHSVYDVEIAGITPNMIDIGEQKVESGRYITEPDYQHESMVCFIGQDLVDAFFPNVDPLDKEIWSTAFPFASWEWRRKSAALSARARIISSRSPLPHTGSFFRRGRRCRSISRPGMRSR